jgi:phosphoglycolate phosphatase
MATLRTVVVGFDLDLTLVDSAPGIGATLRAALAAEGVPERPSDELLHPYIGIPLEATVATIAPHADPHRVALRYRRLYPEVGVPGTCLLPGVTETFAAVRARGGLILVVSAKVEPAVRAVLEHVGLDEPQLAPDVVVGGLFGSAKGMRLLDAGAHVYVGDHPGDMEAARVAGAVGVGVTTGGSSAAALWAAGADVVLPGLPAFAQWFDAWFEEWFDRWFDGELGARGSAASGSGLHDETGERDGEADGAEHGQRGDDAGG